MSPLGWVGSARCRSQKTTSRIATTTASPTATRSEVWSEDGAEPAACAKDIVTEKLKALNAYVTQTTARLNEAEIRWRQVQERKATPALLLDLPFISSQSLITQLVQQVAAQKIVISQLREHYRDKHPKMIEAVNSLAQTLIRCTAPGTPTASTGSMASTAREKPALRSDVHCMGVRTPCRSASCKASSQAARAAAFAGPSVIGRVNAHAGRDIHRRAVIGRMKVRSANGSKTALPTVIGQKSSASRLIRKRMS